MEKKKGFVITGIVVAVVIGVSFMLIKLTTDKSSFDNEKILTHIHPRLYLNVDGKPYFVPQNVGIDRSMERSFT